MLETTINNTGAVLSPKIWAEFCKFVYHLAFWQIGVRCLLTARRVVHNSSLCASNSIEFLGIQFQDPPQPPKSTSGTRWGPGGVDAEPTEICTVRSAEILQSGGRETQSKVPPTS